MSGLNQHYQDYYLLPGTYSYPLATSATPTVSAYLPNYDEMSWLVPENSTATYVATPLGVINYLSDLQTQMAFPTPQNLSSGLIYAVLNPVQQHVPVAVPLPLPAYPQAVYGFSQEHHQPVEQIRYYRLLTMSEEEVEEEQEEEEEEDNSTQLQPEEDSTQGAGESAQEPAAAVPAPGKRKRIYQAEEGYLVEEPTSSEDEQDERREEPNNAEAAAATLSLDTRQRR
ncbi:uncharacterized protein LOC111073305 [Drosophila obscura]|uniref:uncharacterized protein LOC111073305 n=1 Tax=Drosophila obscura TaxID=7282 RepID=UPI001BB24F4E|nr:uncharacterized protein LOC111073305 [Drosophila obscura]